MQSPTHTSNHEKWSNRIITILFLIGLYLTSFYNYLLFHSLAELFSIIIAFCIFMFAWNTRQHVDNDYFPFIGIAYLFVAILDTLHTLSYEGMQIFVDYDYYANQVWIATRYLESLSLLAAFYFLQPNRKLNTGVALTSYALITGLLATSIFHWKIFPACFIEGEGQTNFKIASEYIICLILIGATVLLHKNRNQFSEHVFNLIKYSLISTIIAELAFTYYISNYGLPNMIGHFFKIISFKLLYEAVIAVGLMKPQELLYRQLKQSEEKLTESNKVKDHLFSIISHDLRSPIASLLGLSNSLQQDYEHLNEEEKKQLISLLDEKANSTYNLLDNLLRWSAAQTNGIKLNQEPLLLDELFEANLELQQEAARQKGVILKMDIQPNTVIYADATITNTVLRNLLSNAIKFTNKDGMVKLSSKTMGDQEEITVADTGVGISDADMEELFNGCCGTSKPGTANEKGMGIGLTLCKELIEAHGCSLRAESVQGAGSRFLFTLPKPNKDIS